MLTFSYFTVGFPFNPTSPDYKLSISPTYKKTTVIKRLMGANIHKMNPVDIVRKALVFERDAQGYACEEKVNFWGSELRVDQLDVNERERDLTRQLNLLWKGNRDVRKLGLLTLNGEYLRTLRDAQYDNANRTINKWLTESHAWLLSRTNDEEQQIIFSALTSESEIIALADQFFDGNIEEARFASCSRYILENYGQLLPKNKEKGLRVFNALCIILLSTKDPQVLARGLKYVWAWAFTVGCQEIIPYIYSKHRTLITPERYPFLNFAVIELAAQQLLNHDSGLSVPQQIYYSMLNSRIAANAVAAQDYSAPARGFNFLSQNILECLSHISLVDMVKTDIFFIESEIDKFVGLLKENATHKRAREQLKEAGALLTLNDDDIHALQEVTLTSSHFPTLCQRRQDITRSLISASEALHSTDSESSRRLKDIEEESRALATAPLDNIATLTALKEERDLLSLQLEEQQKASVLALLEHVNEAVINITRYQASLSDITSPNTNHNDDEKVPASLLQRVEGDLNDERQRRNELEKKLSRYRTLEWNNTSPEQESKAPDPSNIISASIAYGQNPTLESAFLLFDTFSRPVTLSPTAWRSIKNNKVFSRSDSVLEILDILTSASFLSTYDHHGSQACFSLIPNKRLSFSESESVDNANLRDFKFKDGVTRTCNAHLRFGVNNDASTMLRIYFCIEDGHVYIGDVTKHAPLK